MDGFTPRGAIVTLAVLGAVLSVCASVLQSSGRIGAERAKKLNMTGYGFMAASMLLFIAAGFRA